MQLFWYIPNKPFLDKFAMFGGGGGWGGEGVTILLKGQ